ncbi:hypothetical protein Tco_0879357 [Tanacetum coccineum]
MIFVLMEKGCGEENIQFIINKFTDMIMCMENNNSSTQKNNGVEASKQTSINEPVVVMATDDNIWYLATEVNNDTNVAPGSKSFVNVVAGSQTSPKVKFRTLFNEEQLENTDFVLPMENNYVNNTWSKFGFQSVIKDDDDVYYFKFTPMTGMEQVLEKALGTQIGKTLMPDAFTGAMCTEPWGRIGFARALIEVTADKKLKEEIVMVVPKLEEEGTPLSECGLNMSGSRQDNGRRKRRNLGMVLQGYKTGRKKGKNVEIGHNSDEVFAMKLKNSFTAFQDDDDGLISKDKGASSSGDNGFGVSEKLIPTSIDTDSEVEDLGDFNVALNMEDSFFGSSRMNSAMCDFKDCIESIDVFDINSFSLHYTWNQKPNGSDGILKNPDRIMGNITFLDLFQGSYALFQPYRISDHSPSVLKIPSLKQSKPKPFKFYYFLAYKDKFMELIASGWNNQCEGHNMFRVVQKLKALKKPLRKLLQDQGNLHTRVNELRVELDAVQRALDLDPSNDAKIDWLKACDSNSAYFHKVIKSRNHRSRIDVITNADNVEVLACDVLDSEGLYNKKVSDVSNTNMVRHITDDEIKHAMFSMGEDKALGPNGYTSTFFKKGWNVIDGILKVFGFHPTMVKWVMSCVTSTSYSICINGYIHGYFNGKRGLHQGDPLSPYLFTLVMEILTGDIASAKVIMDSLNEFKNVSGLVPSIPKSTTFFCNVLNHVKIGILNIMPFSERKLPVKYLGVPLILSRLFNRDCKILVEKARNRIGDWKNKVISNGTWNWPQAWLLKASNLSSISIPNIDASNDRLCWKDSNGNLALFSVKLAWEELRSRGTNVMRCNIVWFPHCIPRYSFHMWLVMRRTLKTQDKLRPWDVAPNIDLSSLRCPLCDLIMDSHEHLFFECNFSSKVWNLVRIYVEMNIVHPSLDDIVLWFQSLSSSRSFKAMVGKLIVVASSYYIWNKRNTRLFKNTRRSPEEVRDLIIVMVRLKLISFRFKNTAKVKQLLALWKMPTRFRLYSS